MQICVLRQGEGVSCAGICYGWNKNKPYEAVAVFENMKIVKNGDTVGLRGFRGENPQSTEPKVHSARTAHEAL